MDLITLGVEVQTTGGAQAAQGLATFQKAATGAAGAADQLENKVNALNGAQGRTVAPARAMAGAMNGLGASFRNSNGMIQNTSFQLQDIIVQMEMGVPAARVLGQQLPQLLGGFGPLGAAIGVAVGLFFAFAPALFGASAAVSDLTEKMDALEDATQRLNAASKGQSGKELAAQYGAQVGAAKELLKIQKQIAQIQADRAFLAASKAVGVAFGPDLAETDFSTALDRSLMLNKALADQAILQEKIATAEAAFEAGLSTLSGERLDALDDEIESLYARKAASEDALGQLSEYRGALKQITENFGISEQAAANLVIQMTAVTQADTTEQQVVAAQALAKAIFEATGGLNMATDEGVALYNSLLDVALAGFEIQSLDFASGIGAGADEAARLVRNLNLAYAVRAALDRVDTTVVGRPDLPDNAQSVMLAQIQIQRKDDADAAAAARAAGSGGGVSAIEQAAARLFESTRTEAEKFAKELANLETLFQGGAIDGDLYARALEDLNQKFDPFTKLIEGIADSVENELNSAFAAVLDGTKSLGDALLDFASNVLAKVAQDLFAQQFAAPIADGLSGLLSGVVGGIAGGGSVPGSTAPPPNPFAKGGVVSGPTIFPFANGTGLMGEAGPEAIMPLSRGADGKLGVTAANGNSAPKITINNYSGQEARASSDGMGNIMVEIGRAVAQDITSGGPTYRAIKTTFGISNRLQQRG